MRRPAVLVVILWALCSPCIAQEPVRCTVVTVSHEDTVLFGCNNDYIITDFPYWVSPANGSSYGAVYFGHPDNVQQGFNDRGLAYDANGLPGKDVTEHSGTIPVYGGHTAYPVQILRECATVSEVIEWVNDHAWPASMHYQMHFADSSGDAVIISVGTDGRIRLTHKTPGDTHLVSTNFNVADPTNGAYPCWRYTLADEMLTDLLHTGAVSVSEVARVMNAVHVENPASWTFLTLVADLREGLISAYYLFQYDDPIVLDLNEELARGARNVPVSSLFPVKTRNAGQAAFAAMMGRRDRLDFVGWIWLGLVLLSTLAAVLFARTPPPLLRTLLPVLVLGPLGLLMVWGWRSQMRRSQPPDSPEASWADAAADAALVLAPVVAAAAAAVSLLIEGPLVDTSSGFQLLLLCVAPQVMTLLLVAAPVAVHAGRGGYPRAVLRAAPGTLSAASVAVGVVLPLSLPFGLVAAGIQGLSALTVVWIWGGTCVAAVPGAGLLTCYYRLLHKRGPVRHLLVAGQDTQTSTAPEFSCRRRKWYGAVWVAAAVMVLILGAFAAARAVRMVQSGQLVHSCTSMVQVVDGTVILGDNEDGGLGHPLAADPSQALVWTFPPGEVLGGEYGCLWLGWDHGDSVSGQAGMNGAGLALGLTSVPEVSAARAGNLAGAPSGGPGPYYRILLECSSVAEAVVLCESIRFDTLSYQMLVADSSGAAAVISPAPGGVLRCARWAATRSFLVVSTINEATGQVAGGPDARRRRDDATEILSGTDTAPGAAHAPPAASEVVRRALIATARDRYLPLGSYTMYSAAFNLTELSVDLHYLSDFGSPASMELASHLAGPPSVHRICDLVDPDAAERAEQRYEQVQRRGRRAAWATAGGLGLAFVGGLLRRVQNE